MSFHTDNWYISRERFAQLEISRGLEQTSTEEKIRKLYDDYFSTGSEESLNDLILNTEKLTANIVYKALSKSAYFTGEVEDALQELDVQLIELLDEDRKKGNKREDIIRTIRAMYKNRAVSIVRTQYIQNARFTTVSMDKMNTDAEGKVRERFGSNDIITDEEQQMTAGRGSLSRQLLEIYLRTMLDYQYDPQKPLGLCFGRILYQLERLFDPEEIEAAGTKQLLRDTRKKTDNYTKALEAFWDVQNPATTTSIAWATRRMAGKNLGVLTVESQRSLQKCFEPTLRWSDHYLQKLQTPSPYKGGTPWKYVVYSEEFTSKQTSDWTESIHKSVFLTSMDIIESDPILTEELLSSGLPFRGPGKKKKGGK